MSCFMKTTVKLDTWNTQLADVSEASDDAAISSVFAVVTAHRLSVSLPSVSQF